MISKAPLPHGTSNWLGACMSKVKMTSEFLPPWNFKLTWASTRLRWRQNSHTHGTSNWLGVSTRLRRRQNSHPHGTSNWFRVSTRLRWYHNSHPHGTSNWLGTKIPTFKLTWSLHKVKMISKLPPRNFKLTWGLTRLRWYQNSHPHGPSNWLGLFPQG